MMKQLPGAPKLYYRRYLSVLFVPDNRSFYFAVIKNLDRYFAYDIYNGVRYFFQLRERISFGDAA